MRIHGTAKAVSLLLVFIVALLIGVPPAGACIHTPAGHPDKVTENLKKAFLFHDGENAHLVIQTELQTASSLPPVMAWVIPLPSVPTHYEVVSADLWNELEENTQTPFPSIDPNFGIVSQGFTAASLEKAGLVMHERQSVGDYDIQPIEIVDAEAGAELNSWLSRNGFGSVTFENQRYYLRKGAAFLAIKLKQLKGSRAEMKPLHITYKADRLAFPLKFSSDSGVFDVELFTFTRYIPSPSTLGDTLFSSMSWGSYNGIEKEFPTLSKLVGNRRGYLAQFYGHNFNASGNLDLASLTADPELSLSPRAWGGFVGEVIAVDNGDTITVLLEGQEEKVRLMGIDAPELDQAPWGVQARGALRSLVINKRNKTVLLVTDITVRDQFKRLLAYVWNYGQQEKGQQLVNLEMVLLGQAVNNTVPPNVMYVKEYGEAQKNAQEMAQKAECGMWNPTPTFDEKGCKKKLFEEKVKLFKKHNNTVPDNTVPVEDFIEGNYWALIIGIDKYPTMDKDKQLTIARKDAEDIAGLLVTRYGFSKERMVELYDEAATHKGIIRAFSSLKENLTDKDSLFIYYAGRSDYEVTDKGKKDFNSMGYWLPSDAKPEDTASFIFNPQVRDYMANILARHIYLVVDSAFSGSLMGRTRKLGLSTSAIKELYQEKSRWVLASGGLYPVPDVADKSKVGHSTFAWHFMKILKVNTQPHLLAKDIAEPIAIRVSNEVQDQLPRSAPVVGAGDEGGQFVFRLDREFMFKEAFKEQHVLPKISSGGGHQPVNPGDLEEQLKKADEALKKQQEEMAKRKQKMLERIQKAQEEKVLETK